MRNFGIIRILHIKHAEYAVLTTRSMLILPTYLAVGLINRDNIILKQQLILKPIHPHFIFHNFHHPGASFLTVENRGNRY